MEHIEKWCILFQVVQHLTFPRLPVHASRRLSGKVHIHAVQDVPVRDINGTLQFCRCGLWHDTHFQTGDAPLFFFKPRSGADRETLFCHLCRLRRTEQRIGRRQSAGLCPVEVFVPPDGCFTVLIFRKIPETGPAIRLHQFLPETDAVKQVQVKQVAQLWRECSVVAAAEAVVQQIPLACQKSPAALRKLMIIPLCRQKGIIQRPPRLIRLFLLKQGNPAGTHRDDKVPENVSRVDKMSILPDDLLFILPPADALKQPLPYPRCLLHPLHPGDSVVLHTKTVGAVHVLPEHCRFIVSSY